MVTHLVLTTLPGEGVYSRNNFNPSAAYVAGPVSAPFLYLVLNTTR